MCKRVLPAVVLALAAGPASAAIFCAGDSWQLADALQTAAENGEDDVIRIGAGHHYVPVGGFVYQPAPLGPDALRHLSLSGGWTAANGQPCGRSNTDPWLTVLDGDHARRILRIHAGRPGSSNAVTVKQLTFLYGHAVDGDGWGGGLLIGHYMGDLPATVTVERNNFIGNRAERGGGLLVGGYGYAGVGLQSPRSVRIVNNLFLSNDAQTTGGAINTLLHGEFDALYLSNNTILNNASEVTGVGGVALDNSVRQYIANNLLWGNTVSDLHARIQDNGIYHVVHNDLQRRTGAIPDIDQGNVAVAPSFQTGLFNFAPVRESPLVDAGRHPTTLTIWPGFGLTALDLAGGERVVGAAVDIGAFENERLFHHGFQNAGL